MNSAGTKSQVARILPRLLNRNELRLFSKSRPRRKPSLAADNQTPYGNMLIGPRLLRKKYVQTQLPQSNPLIINGGFPLRFSWEKNSVWAFEEPARLDPTIDMGGAISPLTAKS